MGHTIVVYYPEAGHKITKNKTIRLTQRGNMITGEQQVQVMKGMNFSVGIRLARS